MEVDEGGGEPAPVEEVAADAPQPSLLQSIEAEGVSALLKAVDAYHNEEGNSLEQELQDLAREDLEQLWSTIDSFFKQEDNRKSSDFIGSVVTLSSLTLSLPSVYGDSCLPPPALASCLSSLHSLLPGLREHKLSDEVCRLLEDAFIMAQERQAWEQPDILHCLQLLASRVVRTKGTKAEVKRLWSIHGALQQLNLQLEEGVRACVLKTASCALLYTCPEGVKWLTFLFSLSPGLVRELHTQVRNGLPSFPKTACKGLGEVYLKAWTASGGEFKASLEEGLQDLMYRHLVAPRGPGSGGLAPVVLRVLQVLHSHKRARDVQSMVARLVEPFLWRHLKVANSIVRRNAAEQFFSAYPVEDLEQGLEERAGKLERQHTLMLELLSDEDPDVRCASVEGVTYVLERFWLVIPASNINSLVKALIKQNAFDTSSSKVRVATLRGLSDLVSNCPPSHVYMKKVLPRLGDCLHDPNEGVRVALLELLLNVKQVKSIKFWSIASLDDLLARLESDKSFVCRRIVKLLSNSYFPTSQGEEAILERCIHMVGSNRVAARRFYQFTSETVSIEGVVQLMLGILASIKVFLKTQFKDSEEKENSVVDSVEGGANSSGRGRQKKRLFSRSRTEEDDSLLGGDSSASQSQTLSELSTTNSESNVTEEQEAGEQGDQEEEAEHPYQDAGVLEGVLEVVCVLWMSRATELSLPENDEYRAPLEKRTGKWVTQGFKYFKGTKLEGVVVQLASFLPDRVVPNMYSYCLARLKAEKAGEGGGGEGWREACDSLCLWRRADTILELVTQGLAVEQLGTKRRSSGVRFAEVSSAEERLSLATRLLSYLLGQHTNRSLLLAKCEPQLREIMASLGSVPRAMENLLAYPNTSVGLVNDLASLLSLSLQLSILLDDTEAGLAKLETLISWAEREILLGELMCGEKAEGTNKALVSACIDSILEILGAAIALQRVDPEFTGKLLDWLQVLLSRQGSCVVASVLDLLIETVSMAGDRDKQEWGEVVGEGVPVAFAKVLSWVTEHGGAIKDEGREGEVEKGLQRMLKTYKKLGSEAGDTENLEDLVEVMVTAVVAEMRTEVERIGLVDLPDTLVDLGQVPRMILRSLVNSGVDNNIGTSLTAILDGADPEEKLATMGSILELLHVVDVKGSRTILLKIEEVLSDAPESGDADETDNSELRESVKKAVSDVMCRIIGPTVAASA